MRAFISACKATEHIVGWKGAKNAEKLLSAMLAQVAKHIIGR